MERLKPGFELPGPPPPPRVAAQARPPGSGVLLALCTKEGDTRPSWTCAVGVLMAFNRGVSSYYLICILKAFIIN